MDHMDYMDLEIIKVCAKQQESTSSMDSMSMIKCIYIYNIYIYDHIYIHYIYIHIYIIYICQLDSIAPPGASHAVGSFSQPKGSFRCPTCECTAQG